jgi:hypothetical protein
MPFGKREGGGRRGAGRRHVPLLAVFTSVTMSRRIELVDLSSTGARLSGEDLPDPDEELFLNIEDWRAFGRVVWRRGGQCGVVFEPPVDAAEVEALASRAANSRGLTAEMKNALDVWMGGSAR